MSTKEEKHLSQVKVAAIIVEKKRRQMVTLDHNTTLGEALKRLSEENILSAPVVLAPSIEDTDSGDYLGILDVLDILQFITKHVLPGVKGKTGIDKWQALRDGGEDILQMKLIQICGHDTGFAFTNYLQRSVLDLITDGFVRSDGAPAHRIAISDGHAGFTHIITQSDVVQYLARHPGTVKGLLHRSLEELGLLRGEGDAVVVVPADMITADVLEVMVTEGVSCVGLVNTAGRLVGNMSASDLRGMDVTDFSLLMSPINRFLQIEKGVEESAVVLTVEATSTFEDLLNFFHKKRVHRVYVRGKDGRPAGLVTLTDLLSVVHHFCIGSMNKSLPCA